MLKKFNLGDRVRVSRTAPEYGGTVGGKEGVVERVSNYHDKYGVTLDGCRNSLSESGFFWFSEENLSMQNTTIEEGLSLEVKINREKAEKLQSMFINDILSTNGLSLVLSSHGSVEIEKVIFNSPATIVFWSDGTKTVVKCGSGETFDEEKGLAMAISKRVLGNNGNYYNEFKKWLPNMDVHNCNDCKFRDKKIYEKPCAFCTTYNNKWQERKGTKK